MMCGLGCSCKLVEERSNRSMHGRSDVNLLWILQIFDAAVSTAPINGRMTP
jgi:hypothetical protein